FDLEVRTSRVDGYSDAFHLDTIGWDVIPFWDMGPAVPFLVRDVERESQRCNCLTASTDCLWLTSKETKCSLTSRGPPSRRRRKCSPQWRGVPRWPGSAARRRWMMRSGP